MIELAYINRDSFSNARYQMEPCIKMLAKVEILMTEENGLDQDYVFFDGPIEKDNSYALT